MRGTAGLRGAAAELAAAAGGHLAEARALRPLTPRAALPALLPGLIAQRSLLRLRRARYDPFDEALSAPDPLQSWRLAAAALFKQF